MKSSIIYKNIKISGWKSIKNELTIDFESDVRKSKTNEILLMNNTFYGEHSKTKKYWNKLGISGSNAYGKTSLIESFEKVFSLLQSINLQNYKNEIVEHFEDFINYETKKLNINICVFYLGYEHEYNLDLDLNTNTFVDKFIKWNKKRSKEIFIISSNDFSEMNSRLLFHFPLENEFNELSTSASEELKNIATNNNLDLLSFSKYLEVIKNISGKYLDFYNSNYEKKYSNPTLGLNRLQLVLDNKSNRKHIFELFEERKKENSVWNEIVNLLVKIDPNLLDIYISKTDDGNLNYQYVDRDNIMHPLRTYASTGTISSFTLMLWLYINKGNLLLIDELDTSLNINVIHYLLNLSFVKESQLVFTFHNIGFFLTGKIFDQQILLLDRKNSGKRVLSKWSKLTNNKNRKFVDVERLLVNYYGGNFSG